MTVYEGVLFHPRIALGSGTTLENDCHVTAVSSVVVGLNVLIASGVFISDHLHDHRDVSRSVRDQPLRVGGIEIGDDCHLGEHAAIVGSIVIGKHAVVGANAVVTADVPSFTVVAGVPARPISRYDHQRERWVRVE